jgi:RimJ/RimL family protein N-acetyltransferase
MRRGHGFITGAPELLTERLILRGHAAQDFQDYAAMWGDPLVTRFIGGRPFTSEECWSRLLRAIGHWPVMGYGYWLVFDRASGRLVGETGLGEFKRDISPSFEGAPEAGWVLAPWAHGRGYATEAVSAAMAWSDEHVPERRTVCIIAPENAASVRVAEKCGYRQIESASYRGEPVLVFERTRA